MILLMWALTGPEWICLLPQRCGIMGCHIVLLLHFYTLKDELWLTKAFKGERIQTTFTERWINLKTQFTFENSWSFSLRSLSNSNISSLILSLKRKQQNNVLQPSFGKERDRNTQLCWVMASLNLKSVAPCSPWRLILCFTIWTHFLSRFCFQTTELF